VFFVAREMRMLPGEYVERVTWREHLALLEYLRRPSRDHRYLAMIAYNVIRPHLKEGSTVTVEDFLLSFSQEQGPGQPSERHQPDDGLTDDERLARAAYNSKVRWGRVMGRNPDGSHFNRVQPVR
jgi:hypothetical protein